MTTIASGSSATITIAAGGRVSVATNGGMWSTSETPAFGVARNALHGPTAHSRVFGPYPAGASLTITNQTVNALNYVDFEVSAAAFGTVAVGASQAFTLADQGSVTVSNPSGYWQVVVTPAIGNASTGIYGPGAGNMTFGPYAAGATVTVTNQSGGVLVTSAVGSGGGGAQETFGGITRETAGSGIYSGMTLSDGDNFTALSIVSAANRAGSYFATRGGYGNAGVAARAPATGSLAPNVYVDASYTGIADANRGVPMTFDGLGGVGPHTLVTIPGEPGGIQLLSGRQSAAEKAVLNGGTNPERAAMLSFIGRIGHRAPFIFEAKINVPAGPAGWHPSFWAYTAHQGAGFGNEFGFEGSSANFNAYHDEHSGGGVSANTGTLQIPANGGHDGNFHILTVIATLTYWSFLVDGVEVNRIGPGINYSGSNSSNGTWSPANHALSEYFMLTAPAFNQAFLGDNYSSASWAAATAGVALKCAWWRVWRQNAGSHFTPKTATVDYPVVAGQALSITLPSRATLWGSTAPTSDFPTVIPIDLEEPVATLVSDLPSWMSYNSTTRILSGTVPNNSGWLNMAVVPEQAGCTHVPYRFTITVAPFFSGATAASFISGTAGSYDLYAAWDCGRFIGTAGGRASKQLTATGLPAGMTLNSAGQITGTPSASGTFTVTTTCTNLGGQQATGSITMTVADAVSTVAAPTGLTTSGLTLVGSWEPAANLNTLTGSIITAMAGTDGTTASLTGTSTKGMTLTTVADGNGNQRSAAQAVSTTAQYLTTTATALGLTTASAVTIVLVGYPTHALGNLASGVSMAMMDLAQGGTANLNANHLTLLANATAGVGYDIRRNGSVGSGNTSATQGANYATNVCTVVVVRSPALNAAGNQILNVGSGANVTGVGADAFSGLDAFTLGCAKENNAFTRPADMVWFKCLFYKSPAALLDSDEVILKNWAQTGFGAAA